jgi:hypothetical protein
MPPIVGSGMMPPIVGGGMPPYGRGIKDDCPPNLRRPGGGIFPGGGIGGGIERGGYSPLVRRSHDDNREKHEEEHEKKLGKSNGEEHGLPPPLQNSPKGHPGPFPPPPSSMLGAEHGKPESASHFPLPHPVGAAPNNKGAPFSPPTDAENRHRS